MTGRYKVEWVAGPDGEHRNQTVRERDELARLIDALEREALSRPPFMVDLQAEDGSVLGIGLGRSVSVAHYVSRGGDPPYFLSVGPFNDMPEVIVYYAGGQWTEFPGTSAVPYQEARAALEEFFTTGELPQVFDWRET